MFEVWEYGDNLIFVAEGGDQRNDLVTTSIPLACPCNDINFK
jgi:hypothetical protein